MRVKGDPCSKKWCVALVEKDGQSGCKIHSVDPNYVPSKLSISEHSLENFVK